MRNVKKRLLYLIKILRETDERRPITAAQIVKKLRLFGIDACIRTVGNDIAALREAGYCIPVHPNRRRGYYLADHDLEDYEVKLLADMVADTP